MRKLLFTTICICTGLLPFTSFAQQSYFIEGITALCLEECGEYAVYNDDGIPVMAEWFVFPNGSHSIQITDDLAVICFFEPGTYTISAFLPNQQVELEPVTVLVGESQIGILEFGSCSLTDTVGGRTQCYTYCVGQTGEYRAYGNDPGTTVPAQWTASGGEITYSDPELITIRWDQPGIYYLTADKLTTTCPASHQVCIEVIADPEAAINSTPSVAGSVVELCRGEEITLLDASTNATAYQWILPDGSLAQGDQFTTSFDLPGNYTIGLLASNNCGCSDTASIEIVVNDALSPQLDCIGTVCPGTQVTYQAIADCDQFQWAVSSNGTVTEGGGPGDDFISVEWNGGPNGYIELLASDCQGTYCSSPVRFRIPILSPDGPVSGDSDVCPYEIVTYQAPFFEGTSYSWSVSGSGTILEGQGTKAVKVWWRGNVLPAENEWVEVLYDNCYLDCNGSDRIDVVIRTDYSVSGDRSVCEGEPGSFEANTIYPPLQPVNSRWELYDSDGTLVDQTGVSSNYDSPSNISAGSYSLIARIQDPDLSCREEFIYEFTVDERPPAPGQINGPDTICPGDFHSFSSSPLPGHSAEWTVVDGRDSTLGSGPEVRVRFGTAPPFKLLLRQIDLATGCPSAPLIKNLVKFGVGDVEGPTEACVETFSDYQIMDPQQQNYNWSIHPPEAGAITSGQGSPAVNVFWSRAGDANITVVACGDTSVLGVQVNDNPRFSILGPDSLCNNDSALYTIDSAFAAYAWYDRSGNLLGNARDQYLHPGLYTVEVTDQNGCTASSKLSVSGLPYPSAVISAREPKGYCHGDPPIPIAANISGQDGYTYRWFHNGNLHQLGDSVIMVDVPGEYFLEITSPNGCMNVSNIIEIFPHCIEDQTPGGAVCNIVPNDCPDGLPLDFAAALGPVCNLRSFRINTPGYVPGSQEWYFENHQTGEYEQVNEENPDHTFSSAGYYSVVLYAMLELPGGMTCNQHIEKIIEIPLAADFTTTDVCDGEAMKFHDLSTRVPGEEIVTYEWNFDDPGSGADNASADPSPTHLFSQPGIFNVQLRIQSQNGCWSEMARTVVVHAAPSPAFNLPPDVCLGNSIQIDAGGSPDFDRWVINGPSGVRDTFYRETIYFQATSDGTYSVELIASNADQCEGTVAGSFNVSAPADPGDIQIMAGSPLCQGDTALLRSPPGGAAWNWSNGAQTEQIAVVQSGIYRLSITDPTGCNLKPDSVYIEFGRAPSAAVGAFATDREGNIIQSAFDSLDVCEGQGVKVVAYPQGNYQYVWSNGGNGDRLNFPAGPSQLPQGRHLFYAELTDLNSGCRSMSDTVVVNVHAAPDRPLVTSDPNGILCEGQMVNFQVSNPLSVVDYFWNNGIEGVEITTDRAGVYQVTAVNTYGCISQSEEQLVQKAPDPSLIPSGCLIRCNPDTICLPNIPDLASIRWFKDGQAVPGPDGQSLSPVFEESGSYYAELVSSFGCSSTSKSLDLTLFDGFGYVLTSVYVDVNNNGMVDPGVDTLYRQVEVKLGQDAQNAVSGQPDADRIYRFGESPAGAYMLWLDSSSLAPGIVPIIGRDSVEIVGCDKEVTAELLIKFCRPDSTFTSIQICEGDSVQFGGQWYAEEGAHTVLLKNSEGCDSIIDLELRFSSDFPVVEGSVTLGSGDVLPFFTNYIDSSNYIFQWLQEEMLSCADCPDPQFLGTSDTTITVSVHTPQGCAYSLAFEIRVENNFRVYIPNAFSPNGDGLNDHFRLFSSDPVHIMRLCVFDRWGNKVFEERDGTLEEIEWNGTFKGRQMNPAVFVYWAELQFPDGEIVWRKGDLMLVR